MGRNADEGDTFGKASQDMMVEKQPTLEDSTLDKQRQNRAKMGEKSQLRPSWAAFGSQEAAKSAHAAPKTRPRAAQERPRGAQGSTKAPISRPRELQERPRHFQERGRRAPRGVFSTIFVRRSVLRGPRATRPRLFAFRVLPAKCIKPSENCGFVAFATCPPCSCDNAKNHQKTQVQNLQRASWSLQNRARATPRCEKIGQERPQTQQEAQNAAKKRPRAKKSANMAPTSIPRAADCRCPVLAGPPLKHVITTKLKQVN